MHIIINTWLGHRCKSGIAIFAFRVILNYRLTVPLQSLFTYVLNNPSFDLHTIIMIWIKYFFHLPQQFHQFYHIKLRMILHSVPPELIIIILLYINTYVSLQKILKALRRQFCHTTFFYMKIFLSLSTLHQPVLASALSPLGPSKKSQFLPVINNNIIVDIFHIFTDVFYV